MAVFFSFLFNVKQCTYFHGHHLAFQLECCGASGTRDWQNSAYSRAHAAAEAGASADAGAAGDTLDLSISAPSAFYYVPASCCAGADSEACAAARRVPAASGAAPGLHAAACAPRVLAALEVRLGGDGRVRGLSNFFF